MNVKRSKYTLWAFSLQPANLQKRLNSLKWDVGWNITLNLQYKIYIPSLQLCKNLRSLQHHHVPTFGMHWRKEIPQDKPHIYINHMQNDHRTSFKIVHWTKFHAKIFIHHTICNLLQTVKYRNIEIGKLQKQNQLPIMNITSPLFSSPYQKYDKWKNT